MEKRKLYISYLQYETPGNLPEQDARLLESAKHALRLAYAPYSQFRVGAAALLENGEIVEGANYENASYPLCLCAERAALAAAVSKFPEIPMRAMAVTVENHSQVIYRPATPCGACRQVLAETEIKNRQAIRLILQGQTGPVWMFEKSSDLLPFGFDGSYLSAPILDKF
jgi:cytidine deaminase